MSTSIDTPIDALAWARCDVNQLAAKFHYLEGDQFRRMSQYPIDIWGIQKLEQTRDFKLFLALQSSEDDRTKPAFYTILKYDESESVGPVNPQTTKSGAQVVPAVYLDFVKRNWLELDANLIDDAFLATHNQSVGLERLLAYHVNNGVNENLWKFLNDHQKLNLFEPQALFHLGIDYNKRPSRGEYRFSAVLEFEYIRSPDLTIVGDLSQLGFVLGKSTDGDGESQFYQYIQPCPPACQGG